MNWPDPRNAKEIRSYMGLVDYYRTFVEGFSYIAYTVTSLQKKRFKFEWSSEYEKKIMLTFKDVLVEAQLK